MAVAGGRERERENDAGAEGVSVAERVFAGWGVATERPWGVHTQPRRAFLLLFLF